MTTVSFRKWPMIRTKKWQMRKMKKRWTQIGEKYATNVKCSFRSRRYLFSTLFCFSFFSRPFFQNTKYVYDQRRSRVSSVFSFWECNKKNLNVDWVQTSESQLNGQYFLICGLVCGQTYFWETFVSHELLKLKGFSSISLIAALKSKTAEFFLFLVDSLFITFLFCGLIWKHLERWL